LVVSQYYSVIGSGICNIARPSQQQLSSGHIGVYNQSQPEWVL